MNNQFLKLALILSIIFGKNTFLAQVLDQPVTTNSSNNNIVLSNPVDSSAVFYLDFGGYGELWTPSFSTGLTGCLELRFKHTIDIGFGFRKGLYDMHKKNTNFQENYGVRNYPFPYPKKEIKLLKELHPYFNFYLFKQTISRNNIRVKVSEIKHAQGITSIYAKVSGESLLKAGFRAGFTSFASNYGDRRNGGRIPTNDQDVTIGWPGFTTLSMNMISIGGIVQLVDNITIRSQYGIKSKKIRRSIILDFLYATNYTFSDVKEYVQTGLSSSNTYVWNYYIIPTDISFRRFGMKLAYMDQPFKGFNLTTKIEGGLRPGFNTGELKHNLYANLS